MNNLKEIYLFFNNLKLELYKVNYIQKFVGNFPNKKRFFPEYANKTNSKIFFLENKGGIIKKPSTSEKKIHEKFPKKYKVPNKQVFVGLIKNARILSKNANIITEDKIDINEDISSLSESMTSYENYLVLPKIKTIDSRVLTISNSENYFHWMFEILPRLHFIKKTGLKTDYYLLPSNKQFQKDSIKALKIPEKKIINLNEKTHIKTKEVLFSSMPSYSGNPTPEICSFVRKLFLKKYDKKKYKKYEKIYVCRGNVKYRKVSNEKEVISFLEKKGFVSVKMDGLSVFEQARIFNSAKIIIAPHGAALTNLVFCKKGTKVIELFNPDYVNVCFWTIANNINIKYFYVFGERQIGIKQNMLINICVFDKIFT